MRQEKYTTCLFWSISDETNSMNVASLGAVNLIRRKSYYYTRIFHTIKKSKTSSVVCQGPEGWDKCNGELW